MVGGGRQRGRPVELPDHLAVGRRGAFQPRALLLLPRQRVLGLQHADAWVDAGGRSLQTAEGGGGGSAVKFSDTEGGVGGLGYLDCRQGLEG